MMDRLRKTIRAATYAPEGDQLASLINKYGAPSVTRGRTTTRAVDLVKSIRNDGAPLLPIGRGYAGERQRELAYRFGINLVMHVLTGNYKSDQVHVPALLDRLGQ